MKPKIRKALIILFSVVCCLCMFFPLCFVPFTSFNSYAYTQDDVNMDKGKWENLSDEDKYDMWNRIRKLYDYIIKNDEPYGLSDGGRLKDSNKLNGIQSDMQTIKKQTDVDVSDKTTAEYITKYPSLIGELTAVLWDVTLMVICENDPSSSKYLDETGQLYTVMSIDPISNKFNEVTKIFRIAAYSLVLVFFSVNLIEQSVKYEIFTVKGALKIFGRLLVAKVIIDLSTTICGKILSAFGQMAVMILGEEELTPFDTFVPDVELEPCGIKLVGNLIDSYIATIISFTILLIVGTIMILSCFVVIKLVIRAFELTILVCTSPVFFACASSDVTKEYTKKFIITFLEVAAQTLFMSIVLKIGMETIKMNFTDTIKTMEDLGNYLQTCFPTGIIAIAMCVMMIKPPKVLTNLLKG